MQNQTSEDELIAHLCATDRLFRELTEEHAQFKKQIEKIETMAHISGPDELEEQRLKKLKLQAKDKMNQILSLHKHAVTR